MRLKTEYKVREMAGEHVVIMQGQHGSDLTRIISLNESALLVWNTMQGCEFTAESVAKVLMKSYAIDSERALADARSWIEKLKECGLVES